MLSCAIDPNTEVPGRTIPVPQASQRLFDPTSDVAFGLGQVYVEERDGSVARVDPKRNLMIIQNATVGEGGEAGVGRPLAAGSEGLWVATYYGLAHLDASSLEVLDRVAGPRYPAGLATGAGWVWMADAYENTVWRFDPAFGRVSRTFDVEKVPTGVAVGAGSVWVTATDGIVTRLDPAGRDSVTIPLGGTLTSVAIGYGLVWVTVQ